MAEVNSFGDAPLGENKGLEEELQKKRTSFEEKYKLTEWGDLEKFLKDKTGNFSERVREATLFLKNQIDEFLRNEIEEFLKNEIEEKRGDPKGFFLDIIEIYFLIFEKESNINNWSRFVIKILHITDLMLEKYIDNHTYQGEIQRAVYGLSLKKGGEWEADWRIIRKIYDQSNSYNTYQLSSYYLERIREGFLRGLDDVKKAIIWRGEKNSLSLIKEIIDKLLLEGAQKSWLEESLMRGRFELELNERLNEPKQRYTLILGDEGGLFLLMKSIAKDSLLEKIIIEEGVSKDYLEKKRRKKDR